MKKVYHLTAVCLLCSFLLPSFCQAQSPPLFRKFDKSESRPAVPRFELESNHSLSGSAEPAVPPSEAVLFRNTELETVIGETIYDLQTNYSVCNRISEDADGNIMAVWTMGFNSNDGYSDRGTGYNRYDAATGAWGNTPAGRLEDGIRTGWPNHVITDAGNEFIVGHVFASGEYRLHTLRRPAGTADWIESDIPTDTPVGTLWPQAAVSGETVHVIGVATPTGNLGGQIYAGVDMHILYYRSPDGGETWDIVDGIIPGLDSTHAADIVSADSYTIDARGEVVTVGVFSQWNDIVVFKSTDGGANWTSTRLHDFPIDHYEINQGYTLADLPPYDTLAPDSLAIFTSDNGGQLLIDKNGMVHAFFGEMYVQDTDTTDAGWVYYPGTDGLAYWNESFGPDSIRTIANILDLNGNDTLDIESIDHIATYFQSMTSTPSAAVDEDNTIYLTYSMVMEGAEYRLNEDEQHYRHLWVIASEDGGETWSEPYNAINEVTTGDPDFPFFIEAVFPAMVRDITDEVKLMYQQDFRPGMNSRGDMDIAENNNIVFLRLTDVLTKAEEVVAPETFRMNLFPNPASGAVNLAFELEGKSIVKLQLLNLNGQQLGQESLGNLAAGLYRHTVDLDGLPRGVYLMKLNTADQTAVRRLVVE